MARILIAGATGFIGKRLVYHLLSKGHEIYALSRVRGAPLKTADHARLHILYGDLQNPLSVDPFPEKLDAAYYLVHSLGTLTPNLTEVEQQTALHFRHALEKTTCKQIIFLGGIIENENELSPHLRSRLEVEKILKQSPIPCTILRSSIIIGAGSASFEIIRDLVEKLPLMVAPRWVKSVCQPIGIWDVLFYLAGVLLNPMCLGKTFDLGGPDVMSFREVLLRYASFRGLKRYIINVPVLTPHLSSYWLVFITTVNFSICQYLVNSMKQNTRKLNCQIDTILPHLCLTYEEALERAFQKIAQNEVVSTWMDAWDLKTPHQDIQDCIEVPQEGCLRDQQVFRCTIPLQEVQRRIWRIGGRMGWYSMNWAWRLRGFIDKCLGGSGFNRGRKHPTHLEVGDSVDFWRVLLADEKTKHVIFYAQMKIPGEAWLEFKIDEEKKLLIQTATFRPKSVLGRLYWYAMLPFHFWIFRHMAKAISQAKLS